MASKRYTIAASILIGLFGFLGMLTYLPAIPRLIPAGMPLPFSMGRLMVIGAIQLGLLVALFSIVGTLAGGRVGLRSQVALALAERTSLWKALTPQLLPGLLCGLLGAVAGSLMSKSLMAYLGSFPIWMRLFYGGFTEEVFARWFLLSGLAWLIRKVAGRGREPVMGWPIWMALGISQALFAGMHWPVLSLFSTANPFGAVGTIFLVSAPWGWLFCKFGIEASMLAHLSFHLSVSGILVLTG